VSADPRDHLPHDLKTERAALGAIMLSPAAAFRALVEEGLEAGHFYREEHRVVYRAMLELHSADEGVDRSRASGVPPHASDPPRWRRDGPNTHNVWSRRA
jgi:DnaB-like helicase N terminal domain